MSWVDDVIVFRHDMFIVFIECKFDDRGTWYRRDSPQTKRSDYEVLGVRDNSEYNLVTLIEPDRLRRTIKFDQGATIGMNGNVLSYQSGYAEEIVVDEETQQGKGKTRDILT
jgi:hypothetical protein